MKKNGIQLVFKRLCAIAVSFLFLLSNPFLTQAPAFEVQVTEGSASVAKEGDSTTITTSARTVFEGNTSILANESVRIVGPSDVLLRDITGSRTEWLGSLLADGNVVLVNSQGVFIGEAARINTGSLIASTLDIRNEDFLRGALAFEKVPGLNPAEILNQADIKAADGGYLIFLADRVQNQGKLTAFMGSVALGSGEKITVSFDAKGLVNLVVDKGLAEQLRGADGGPVEQIVNTGELRASGGRVEMTAKLVKMAIHDIVNNEGILEAARVVDRGGFIEIVADGGIRQAGRFEAADVKVKAEGILTLHNGSEIRAERSELLASRVELAGDGDQYFWGDMTIQNLFYQSGVRDLESSAYPKRLFFEPGRTVTFTDSLFLEGAAGGYNIVMLGSAVQGQPWFVNVLAANPHLARIGVGDSVNIGNAVLNATPSSSFGGNIGWHLNTVFWTGAVNHAWSNAGNWDGGVPANQDVVFRTPLERNFVSNVDEDITINSLDMQDTWTGTINLLANLTVTNDLNQSGSSTFNETQAYDGGEDFTVTAGGEVNFGGARFQGVFRVTTANELEGITGQDLSAQYVLANDIDASGIENFAPIGTFTGYFEGAGFTVSGLTINRPEESNVGLFGSTSDATIQNLGLTGVNITGNDNVGGLVGNTSYQLETIDNVYVTGTVTGNNNVGGLVGYNYNSAIDNSYSSATVSGNDKVGGLVGYNRYSSTIDNSYATGSVNGTSMVGGLVGYNYDSSTIDNSYATGSVTGNDDVGGLVGKNYDSATITKSYATGDVEGVNNVGGLVGKNYYYSNIDNSYATGAVTGSSYVGGLVGYHYYYSTIDNSYATGLVTGDTDTGGLVGYTSSSDINNSFYDSQTTGQNDDDGRGTPQTTAQMKQISTFTDAGWEPGNKWVNRDGSEYPTLSWQHPTWTGAGADSNWSTAQNWFAGVAPGATTLVVFNGTGTANATQDIAQVDGVWIGSDYSGGELGSTITQAANLTVDFDIFLNGGTLAAGAFTLNVAGNWTRNNGTFNLGTSTVNFNGMNQTIRGATVFNNLQKLAGGGSTLTFSSDAEQTVVNGELKLQGTAAGNLLLLRSTSDGTQWTINSQGTATLEFLDVKDSNASGNALNAVSSANSGNNTNWTFTAPVPPAPATSTPPPTGTTPAKQTAVTQTNTALVGDTTGMGGTNPLGGGFNQGLNLFGGMPGGGVSGNPMGFTNRANTVVQNNGNFELVP